VDVGHFHEAPGALSASGVAEFEFNVALAQDVSAALQRSGFEVRMIGERGDYSVLRERTRDAAGAALFVSIHHDSVKQRYVAMAGKFSGYSLFVSRDNPHIAKSLACASAIGSQLRRAGFVPSRYHADPVLGEARAFADETNGVHYFDRLAIGRSAAMPSVLVEAGVIANAQEELRLREPRVRRRIAQAIADGVSACL
jgi:N-acetylmuramoyl-L-alanine amidase